MKSRDDRSEDEELDTVRSRSQDKCGLHGSLTEVKFYTYVYFCCLFILKINGGQMKYSVFSSQPKMKHKMWKR